MVASVLGAAGGTGAPFAGRQGAASPSRPQCGNPLSLRACIKRLRNPKYTPEHHQNSQYIFFGTLERDLLASLAERKTEGRDLVFDRRWPAGARGRRRADRLQLKKTSQLDPNGSYLVASSWTILINFLNRRDLTPPNTRPHAVFAITFFPCIIAPSLKVF